MKQSHRARIHQYEEAVTSLYLLGIPITRIAAALGVREASLRQEIHVWGLPEQRESWWEDSIKEHLES